MILLRENEVVTNVLFASRTVVTFVTSNVTGARYHIDSNVNCDNGGIYVVQGEQYKRTGKTVRFGNRLVEHFSKSKSSALYCHKQECHVCEDVSDFSVTYVENYQKRGKFSLSERKLRDN